MRVYRLKATAEAERRHIEGVALQLTEEEPPGGPPPPPSAHTGPPQQRQEELLLLQHSLQQRDKERQQRGRETERWAVLHGGHGTLSIYCVSFRPPLVNAWLDVEWRCSGVCVCGRFVEALKQSLREKVAQRELDLPPVCGCAASLWDSSPDT